MAQRLIAGNDMRVEYRSQIYLLQPKGFSLIELMVVISIASILIAIAVPSFQAMLDNQRLVTTVNELYADIALTRSQAINNATNGGNGRADLTPKDNANWANGWMVFINKKDDNDMKYNVDDLLISSHGAIPDGIVISTAFQDATTEYIAYQGSGRTRTNASRQQPQLGTITFTQGTQVRRIKINFLGRPRVCDPAKTPATCTSTADNK